MAVREFLHWWRSQLLDLVPNALQRAWLGGGSTARIDITASQALVHYPSASEPFVVPLESAPGTIGEARVTGNPQQIELHIDATHYLLRELDLPAAARPHLAEAVGYQLPRLLPFANDQVLYTCGENRHSAGDGVRAWVAVVPRRILAPALQALGQRVPDGPLPPTACPAAGEPLQLNWRVSEGQRASVVRGRLAWGGLALLLVAVTALHLGNKVATRDALRERLGELRQQAAETGALRDRLENARQRVEWLAETRRTSVSALGLIDTLSSQIDDGTWLESLELQGSRIRLEGISDSAARLIESLEALPMIRDVRFDAAITRDRRGDGDYFNLSALVETPRAEGGA